MKLPPIDPSKDGTDQLAQARAMLRHQRERNAAADQAHAELELSNATSRAEENPRLRGFAQELLALMLKYGVTIDACGCCGSPWVTATKLETFRDRELLEGEVLGCRIFHRIQEYLS